MKVKVLQAVSINGVSLTAGAVADCDANTASNLARKGKVGAVVAEDEAPAPAQDSEPTPKTKKAK